MGFKPRREVGLSPEWRRWVSAALIEGESPARIGEELVESGVKESVAAREVQIIADATESLRKTAGRAALVLRALGQSSPRRVERTHLCTLEVFYERYFCGHLPVVFGDGCRAMAAMQWSMSNLRERFGDAEVAVGIETSETLRFADVIDRIASGSAPPSFYITSESRALAGPLQAMARDLRPLPAFLDGDRARDTANLWMGPAGTVTPLHHDTTHVYFCQFVGKKRYHLVAPWELSALDGEIRGSDSDLDVFAPGDARVYSVDLQPGESLFIPVGWWHRVEALAPSVSVSMRAYHRDADFDWYRPGGVG